MTRRQFSRAFRIEAVKLVTKRGVPAAASPGKGQVRTDLAKIAALKKEVARLRAERDMPRRRASHVRL